MEGDYNLLSSHSRLDDGGVAQDVPAADVSISELRAEAFAKTNWTANSTLAVEAGLRVEASRIGSSGDVALSRILVFPKPRILLTWTPNGRDQLRLRVEREVGQLDFNDFVAASSFSTGQVRVGNPGLVPQQAYVVELAWERHFLKTGAAVVTLRHAGLADVVDRAPVFTGSGAFDAPANIGTGRKDEAIVDATVPLGFLGLSGGIIKAGATWRASSVLDPTLGSRRAISGLRPSEGKLTFTEDIPRRHLSLSASVNRGWSQKYFYYDQVERDVVGPYGSLQIEYKPVRRPSLRLQIYEIGTAFDRRIDAWNGPRTLGAFATRQDRHQRLGPALSLKIRKDW